LLDGEERLTTVEEAEMRRLETDWEARTIDTDDLADRLRGWEPEVHT
jgi:hypothetical protein